MTIDEAKRSLRERALALRAAAHASSGGAGAALAERVLAVLGDAVNREPRPVVSGFWPIGEEIDVRLAMERIFARGCPLALPVVVRRGEPLLFRRWAPGDALDAAGFGTRVPKASAPRVEPDVLIVPFLAADRLGNRLGYGAGYYDLTLRGLRRRRSVVAAGVGYDAQVIDAVPATDRDERLDWAITERRAIECGRERASCAS
jgi:5-formyltetrahydrofolate cyclo-ligase